MQSIVIDTGSWSCKAGFTQEEVPRAIIPSYIARKEGSDNEFLFGREALSSNNSKPIIEDTKIENFENLAIFWKMIIEERLGVVEKERPLLTSLHPLLSKL